MSAKVFLVIHCRGLVFVVLSICVSVRVCSDVSALLLLLLLLLLPDQVQPAQGDSETASVSARAL